AERHRLASEVDRWVIRNAFALVAEKGDEACIHYINISSGGLAERQLIDYVEEQLAEHNVAAEKIGFEINEGDLIRQFNEARELTQAMKKLGCHVALDGFVSGFSLMRNTASRDYDLIKVSRRLLSGAQKDPITRTLLESANRLGHALGSETVAKCPENDEDLKLVGELGFDYVQG